MDRVNFGTEESGVKRKGKGKGKRVEETSLVKRVEGKKD